MTPPRTEIERRYTPGTVELRTEPEQDGRQLRAFHGYALKFAKLSQNLGGFVEQVAGRSTIAKTLADGGDVVARMHHDDRYLLGRVSSGTLALDPDEVGLRYDVTSPDTTYARDLEALARRGDIRHSSFAFRTIDDDWGLTDSGFPVRTLVEVQLVDVAPVVQPAYLDTSSSVRSLAGRLDASPDEVAEMLRSGRLKEALQRPSSVHDLGAESFVPKSSTRRFNPRQPRGNDGKWSDGPGGGGIADAVDSLTGDTPFRSDKSLRLGGGQRVDMQANADGSIDLRLDPDDNTSVVNLSGADVFALDLHLGDMNRALDDRAEKSKAFDKAQANDQQAQALLKARADKYAAARKHPIGSPERSRLQREAGELPEPEMNPYDDGTIDPATVKQIGGVYVGAALSDVGRHIVMSSEPITEDTGLYPERGVEMSPKQARRLVDTAYDVSEESEDRATPLTTESATPDDLHVSLSVRARQLELMRRSFP